MSVSVIIPSCNAVNLKACIKALRYEEVSIIVVDDGLPLGASLYADPAKIVKGEKPFNFSRNVNIGIRAAGEDDVIVLNDDALLETSGGFRLLAEAAAKNPEYGVIAPSCNNVGNQNQQRQTGGGFREEPRMVCFVCVFIPRSTINAVGLLDEDYTGYSHQDDDYCLRVRRAGLKIGIHDGCFVDHGSLPSTFRGPGGPGGDLVAGAEIFRQKWCADNHEVSLVKE